MKVYGIKNCNSVKKALDFFDQKGLQYEFLDIKKLDEATLNLWLQTRTFAELINTAGLSAKKLQLNKEKVAKSSIAELKELVLQTPTLIKRPVIDIAGKILIGKEYEVNF